MSNNKFKVLIIEDEANICSFIQTLLETNGYQALVAQTCVMGMTMFISYNPDLVILDLGLPDRDGLDAIRSIRQKYLTPIIVLSARTTEQDKIEALDLGANDYITKPFVPVEVLARVRSQLRRYAQLGSRPEEGSGSITIGGIVLDDRTKTVTVEGEPVSLTPTEYAILHLLMANPGKVFSTKVLYESVWQEAALGSESSAPVKYDSKFAEIARDAVSQGQISTSMIQRNYEVGFNRAGRIMMQLERAGIVGRQEGAKPRDILYHDLPSLEAKLQELGVF